MTCRTAAKTMEEPEAIILRHLFFIVAHPLFLLFPSRSRWTSYEPVTCVCTWVGVRGPHVVHEYEYNDLSEDVDPMDYCPQCGREV